MNVAGTAAAIPAQLAACSGSVPMKHQFFACVYAIGSCTLSIRSNSQSSYMVYKICSKIATPGVGLLQAGAVKIQLKFEIK